jgi:DNA-directed RNA polymerase specialized sigma24 family protein
VYLVSSDLSFDNPDRMYRVVQVRARFAAERRHREEHGDKDRPGRLARQEQWFRERYSVNSYTDTDCDGESFAVQEVVERDQPEQLDKLADLEEAQLVRDTLLSSTESWAEVLAAHYLEGVSIPGLQERYGLRRSHMYQRLADARLALQSSLSTSTYV